MRPPIIDPTAMLADVAHLGSADLGIYVRLLARIANSGVLPFNRDRLRRMAMVLTEEEGRSLDAVLDEFFVAGTLPDGSRVWRHRQNATAASRKRGA